MSEENTVTNKGQALLDLLQFQRRRDNLTLAELGARIGIDASYLSSMFSGKKKFLAINPKIYRLIAEYLGLPVVVCYLLGGWMEPCDFFMRQGEYPSAVENALEAISRSRSALDAGVTRCQLSELNERVKLLVVLLYEQAEGVTLLPERFSAEGLHAVSSMWIPFEVRLNKVK